jgi:tRNA threonylcarbamoyladenosine biosynthesis protein TsaE
VTLGLSLPDEAALAHLAQRFARAMPESTGPLVVYLEGELGTGKTTFARALIQELGEPGPVRSPTYGLVSEYHTPAGRLLHLDLYRIQDPAELEQLGLGDYLPGSRLWLIEWPERAVDRLPAGDIRLSLSVSGAGRHLEFTPMTQAGRRWLDVLSAGPVS